MRSTAEMISSSRLRIDLVGAEASFREKAIAHRIRESANVAGSSEDGLVREDGAIESEDVIALLHVFPPPVILEVFLQISAEWAVVPATVQSTVDLGRLKNEAFAFTERNNFLHAGGIGLVFISHGSEGAELEKRAGREETGRRPQGKGFFGKVAPSEK